MIRFFSLSMMLGLWLSLAGWAGDKAAVPVSPADLIGNRFILTQVDGKDFPVEPRPYIEFGENMAITGRICNQFKGAAKLDASVLKGEGVVSTRMMCPQEALAKLEPRFFKLLESGLTLRLEGHDLIMRNSEGELAFHLDHGKSVDDDALAEALIGKKFVLRKMGGANFAVEDSIQPFIQFGEKLRVTGSACNAFSGDGLLHNGELKIEQLAATLKMCPDPTLNQFEAMFQQMLRNGCRVAVDGNMLYLSRDGMNLEFEQE